MGWLRRGISDCATDAFDAAASRAQHGDEQVASGEFAPRLQQRQPQSRTDNSVTNVVTGGSAPITYTIKGDGDVTYPNKFQAYRVDCVFELFVCVYLCVSFLFG
jgi:hypothetical protein